MSETKQTETAAEVDLPSSFPKVHLYQGVVLPLSSEEGTPF